MNTQKTTILIFYSGAFLLLSGILLLVLNNFGFGLTNISLVSAGAICGGIGFFMSRRSKYAFWSGLMLVTIMVLYFGWLTIINANGLMDMILDGELQLKPYNAIHQQAASFIFAMAAWALAIITSMTQFVRAYAVGDELENRNMKQEDI
ncbi:MAG: hypothetical protein AB8G11_13135 [Saprospiraceae bacterium]